MAWFEAVTPLDPRSSYIFRDRTLFFLDGRGCQVAAIANFVKPLPAKVPRGPAS